MKLRIRGNSIRIRLGQKEVAALGNQEQVVDNVSFPGGESLRFVINTSTQFSATFSGKAIQLSIPIEQAIPWVTSEELSLSHDLPLSDNQSLRLLIEKDLLCNSDRPRENDSDAFKSPRKEDC